MAALVRWPALLGGGGVAIVRATDDTPLPMWALGAFAVFFATGVIQWICYLDRKSD